MGKCRLVLRAALLLFLIAGLWACGPSDDGGGGTWDATEDFSTTENPHGEWSYGWTASVGSTFNVFPSFAEWPAGPGWYDSVLSANVGAPGLWKNTSGGTVSGVEPGQVSLHTGQGGEYAVLRWTAPRAGSFAIDAQFLAGDSGDTDACVLRNSASVWSEATTNGSPTYSDLLVLAASDTIDFVVGYLGNYDSDNTPIMVTISGN